MPIARISAHARREKSIRHGHISTLHIWWARRPLAACRAVVLASLWPDPEDLSRPEGWDAPVKPARFLDEARRRMRAWAVDHKNLCGPESFKRFVDWEKHPEKLDDPVELRKALLDFIADFSNWDNSTNATYLEVSRALTQAAHEALGGEPGTRPLVVDPFAGGGSIPLEALRVGADAFASDLNPVAVLLNKVVLEYIPKYGQRLADEVRKWGKWVKEQAEAELAQFYPKDPDGATPIAYMWARTIQCEGPSCGSRVPIIRSLWLSKKAHRSVALQLQGNREARSVDFRIVINESGVWTEQENPSKRIKEPTFDGTVRRGAVLCPCCGYITSVESVRNQLRARHGGTDDAQLLCVVTERSDDPLRRYRLATKQDVSALGRSVEELAGRRKRHSLAIDLIPNETISLNELRRISVPLYGMTTWKDLFTARQNLVLTTLVRLAREACADPRDTQVESAPAVQACLSMAIGKLADYNSSLCTWHFHNREKVNHTFARQAIPFVGDFVEVAPFGSGSGNWTGLLDWTVLALQNQAASVAQSTIARASATDLPLASDSANAMVTDPPYYDAVPYAHLSDFFYVWLRRALSESHKDLFSDEQVPKEEEIVVDRPHKLSRSQKGMQFYERELMRAFSESRRVVRPDGVGCVVFASKSTASWEAILQAVVDAGWIVTGSWPIDTEMETRVAAQGQARLGSSVHIFVRPREDEHGRVCKDEVGEWRDVLGELPRRVHDWLTRLDKEGVHGADAIFACLGPALEIFSRYSRVEKSDGSQVTLREYLEHVWAAVSKEALALLFKDADSGGLEPDARLTAMWMWTLNPAAGNGKTTGKVTGKVKPEDDPDAEEAADDEAVEDVDKPKAKGKAVTGFALEYDAARKIAQGLGIHLEKHPNLVEVKGDKARLLAVTERVKTLFGKSTEAEAKAKKAKKKKGATQTNLFAELQQAEEEAGKQFDVEGPKPGTTVLDRVHQAMLLFGAGRGDALKRFLVDDAAGKEPAFWRLVDTLSKLYPKGTDERRWAEGVVARKKGLGL